MDQREIQGDCEKLRSKMENASVKENLKFQGTLQQILQGFLAREVLLWSI